MSGGQVVLAAVLNFLAFAIGGYIVGLKSAGRTILEPGISAAIAVLIALLIAGNFSVVNIIAGGIVPFPGRRARRLARRAPAGDRLSGAASGKHLAGGARVAPLGDGATGAAGHCA